MSRAKFFQRAGFLLLASAFALAIGSAASQETIANAQVATATATSAILQLPTATPTVLGGPTATPSRTPSVAPVLAQALGDINLRSGPGINTDIVGQLKTGDTVPVIGRSNQYPWFVVAWESAPNGQAWVYEAVVSIIGDITTVPVLEAPEPPTLNPVQQSQAETATVLFQTPGAIETATAGFGLQPTGVFTVTPDGGGLVLGAAPTFTPPGEVNARPLPTGAPVGQNRSGIPPAVAIIGLGAMGLLFLGLGLIRRVV